MIASIIVGGDSISRKKIYEPHVHGTVHTVDPINFSRSYVEELATSIPLFEDYYTIVLSGLFSDSSIRDDMHDLIKTLCTSPHRIIITDDAMLAVSQKEFKKYAISITVLKNEKKSSTFNYELVNALESRNVKTLWVAYSRSICTEAPEAIAGLLAWKLKDMILKKKHKAYTLDELFILYEQLIVAYHTSRTEQEIALTYALEEWVLSV